MVQRVFVDSNVLASKTLRDWLFLLRHDTQGMFQTHSSFDVLIEAARVWRKRKPRARSSKGLHFYESIRANLDDYLEDFSEEEDFNGQDVHDYHVHAAAVASNAHILLTSNGRDFGNPDDLPYEIYKPDEFFCLIEQSASHSVRRVTMQQTKYWSKRKESGEPVKTLNVALRDASCPAFAEIVSSHLKALSEAS